MCERCVCVCVCVSNKFLQWSVQSTKLRHSLDITRTNVYYHFDAARDTRLCGHLKNMYIELVDQQRSNNPMQSLLYASRSKRETQNSHTNTAHSKKKNDFDRSSVSILIYFMFVCECVCVNIFICTRCLYTSCSTGINQVHKYLHANKKCTLYSTCIHTFMPRARTPTLTHCNYAHPQCIIY